MKNVETHASVHVHSMLNVTFMLIHRDALVASATREIHSRAVSKLFQVRSDVVSANPNALLTIC